MTPDFKLPDSADKALANLSDHPTKQIGQTLGDMWYLAFGGISALADKRRLKYAHSLEMMKKELEAKVSAIPEEKRVEPDTQIILTALDDAKYCADNKELRELFTNLIAASINKDTVEKVHPAFSSIIKKMTSLDARNIVLFRDRNDLPIANLGLERRDGETREVFRSVFLSNTVVSDIDAQSASIECLRMLGLLEIDTDLQLVDEEVYEPFFRLKEYRSLEHLAETDRAKSEETKAFVKKGIVKLSNFGRKFIEVCT